MSSKTKGNIGITIEEVDKALEEIDKKYSLDQEEATDQNCSSTFKQNLIVLSKEFDSVGLPKLDLSQPVIKVFKQVVTSARSLIHIHRSTITHVKDINIENRTNDSKKDELYHKIKEYKTAIKLNEDKCFTLECCISKLKRYQADIIERESKLKKELEKVKKYHLAKNSELQHAIRKLSIENDNLKSICGETIRKPRSNADIALKFVNEYKVQEKTYQETIQRLEANNLELLNEVLSLREQILIQNKATLNNTDKTY